MKPISGLDLKRARLVPASVFRSPDAVVRSRALSLSQKIEILRRWEFDARRASTPEGRPGGRHLPLLGQVRDALAQLDAHLHKARPARRRPALSQLESA
jgi:hypothetical protein